MLRSRIFCSSEPLKWLRVKRILPRVKRILPKITQSNTVSLLQFVIPGIDMELSHLECMHSLQMSCSER